MSTDNEVAAIVERLLGARPVGIRPTLSPDAFFVELPDRSVVAKLPRYWGRPGSVLVEAWAYRECRARGIRTPIVLAVDAEPECLVLERYAGEPLPRLDRRCWARAGADLRRIHEIRLPGFGPLVPGDPSPRGEAQKWCPFADEARNSGIPWLVDAGYLRPSEAAVLIGRFEAAEPEFRRISDGRLLHGDLEGGHIFCTPDGAYEGILDFGQAQAGDPRWDMARVVLWDGPAALDALLDGYGRETLGSGDREFLLPLYLLAFAVHHAAGHDRPDFIRTLLVRSGYEALL